MLGLVALSPEVLVAYPRQEELEATLIRLVGKNRGIPETQLWLMTMATMYRDEDDYPAPALIAGTIQRMIHRGQLIGIDYRHADHEETLILPPGSNVSMRLPIHVIKNSGASRTGTCN